MEMNISYSLLGFTLFVAIVDWLAVAKKWKQIEHFAKPGVMLLLLTWLWSISGFRGYLAWFAIGLVFSLLGDIFLMLPRERFIGGLVSFLLAHISYTIGFTDSAPPLSLVSIVLTFVVALISIRIYRAVSKALVASDNSQLKIPVQLYTFIISIMLLSALLTIDHPEWSAISSLIVSLGAALFYLSDAFLAWNKFVQQIRHGKLIVIISYHLGQMLIVVGAATHYL